MNTKIGLKSSHIYLAKPIVELIFGETNFAYVAYIPNQQQLLITPVTSHWFAKMHKPKQFLLKSRNKEGDKTLGIREILIDNDLDMQDRDLDYELVDTTKLIKITLT